MERVAFLVEDTGERLPALLNPESLVVRRLAGVRSRLSGGGQLTGVSLSDDPLLYTGGGRTELDLELLFDVSLAGSSVSTNNVRDLTGPLWALAENAPDTLNDAGYRRPRLVRFVWGKAWNVPGVVVAIAERLDRFGVDGSPQRSWLSMRLVRVSEPYPAPTAQAPTTSAATYLPPVSLPDMDDAVAAGTVQVHEVIGGGGERGSGERLDEIALRYYGDASLWRLIATFNDVADPTQLVRGTLLLIPPLPTATTEGAQP